MLPSSVICAAWEEVVSRPGVLRNPSHAATQRRLLGDPHGEVLVQFNEAHIKTKRPPSAAPPGGAVSGAAANEATEAGTTSTVAAGNLSSASAASSTSPISSRVVSRPFDSSRFNFTKVSPAELVATVCVSEVNGVAAVDIWPLGPSPDRVAGGPAALASLPREHSLLVNANPLLRWHGLLVPAPSAGHAQVMTATLLREVALVAAALGRGPAGIALGFNSLGAWASVNHFHMHVLAAGGGLFPSGRFPLEATTRSAPIARGAGITLRRFAAAGALVGFAFEAEAASDNETAQSQQPTSSQRPLSLPAASAAVAVAAADALAATAGAFLESLVARDVAHTVLLADCGRTVLVMPRAFQRADENPELSHRLVVALAEAAGLAIVYTAEDFAQYAPSAYSAAMANVCLQAPALEALEVAAAEAVAAAIAASTTGVASAEPAS